MFVEKVFYSIIRASLWNTSVEIPNGFRDWGAIIKLAKTQALMGLVANVLLTNGEIRSSLHAELISKLRNIPMTNLATHTQMNLTLQRLTLSLREAGIEPVLLKGQGLARNYPIPELRQCGDIDLYVGEECYERTYEALLPIVSEIDDKAKIWNWMHFDAKIGNIMLEVHQKADYMRSRKGDKLYREYMRRGLSENLSPIKFADTDVMTPNDTYNAFYVFYHLWRHFSGTGVGLRQFCDWTCFLHTHVGKLDLPYLKEMLVNLGFMKPWQVFGCFLVKDLGLPEEEFPFYNPKYFRKVERVRDYVMKDGNFGVLTGYSRVRKHSYIKEKWFSFKCHMLRIGRMFMIFPKQTILHVWYVFRDGLVQMFEDLK